MAEHPLRDLTRRLRAATAEHAAASQAGPVVAHCCDHLELLAAHHEGHERERELELAVEALRSDLREPRW